MSRVKININMIIHISSDLVRILGQWVIDRSNDNAI